MERGLGEFARCQGIAALHRRAKGAARTAHLSRRRARYRRVGGRNRAPGTLINLRKGADPESKRFDADYRHFPISKDHEKYQTKTPEVRRWLQEIFQCLSAGVLRYPILFHCTSGKDRTGEAVAVLSLGIERQFIIDEYLLSDGDVNCDWICMALDGAREPKTYFRQVNLNRLKRNILAAYLADA
jgi:protein-tyrosine phosphatase